MMSWISMLLAGVADGHWKRLDGVSHTMLLIQPSPCIVKAAVLGTIRVDVRRYAPAGTYNTPAFARLSTNARAEVNAAVSSVKPSPKAPKDSTLTMLLEFAGDRTEAGMRWKGGCEAKGADKQQDNEVQSTAASSAATAAPRSKAISGAKGGTGRGVAWGLPRVQKRRRTIGGGNTGDQQHQIMLKPESTQHKKAELGLSYWILV